MADTAKLGLRATLHLLGPGPFRRYMVGEAVSMTGTWMQMMAQGWVVASLTTSALVLGIVNFAASIPSLFLAMYAGSLADRHDKRLILQLTQFAQIAGAVLVGYLVQTGQFQVWHLIAVALLLGVSTAFEMPAAAAIVPELVPRQDIFRAIALDRAVFHATRLVGPALAGVCVAQLGAASAFYINALTFVALIAAVATLPKRPPGTAEEEAARQTGFREGLAYVRSDVPTLGMIGVLTLTTTLIFPMVMVLMPIYAVHVLKTGPDGMGILMGLSGVGALVGAFGLLTVEPAQRPARMLLAAGFIALALAGMSQSRAVWQAAGCIALLTLGTSMLIGLANTTIQERAPDALRGRVSAVAGLAFFGIMPFAGIGVSSLVDLMGMRTMMLTNATLFAAGAGWILLTQARRACSGPAREPVAEAAADLV
ncbi:MAG: MFS transporter [Candidatus Sericytochromatia bacterium]|nr:MFS transporter [Candidatus Tanganyikabacteria bacterium]